MTDREHTRRLRAQAHHLKPVVLVGQNGVTPAVVEEIDRALDDHELIKVRMRGHDRESRAAAVSEICDQLEAEKVQLIGGTAVFYRQNKERIDAQRGDRK